MKPLLEVGHESPVALAKWISEFGLGLYAPPPADLEIIYVHPDQTLHRWCENANWHKLGALIKSKLHEFLGSHVKLRQLSYSLELTDSDISAKIDQLPELSNTLLIVMIMPPRVKTGHVLSKLNNTTFDFQKRLRRLKRGAYVSPVEWANLLHGDQKSIIENCLLKGFMAIGAQPWRLANMPLCGSESRSTCFVGIDAPKPNRRGEAMIGGVVLDAWGILRGYHLYKVPQGTGEFADVYTFTNLTTDLIRHFESATNNQVKHLILHRDGRTHRREWDLLPEKLAEQDITMDLVEIRKRNQPLLRQRRNRSGIPSKDIAIGNCELNTAYLNNTLTIDQKIGEKQVYPAPVSICVVKVAGTSPLKELTAQVHALTKVNYAAYRRTVHVPATIYYADAMVGKVSLKGSQTNYGRPLGPDAKPYWL
jgi:argonaute-like protein implicated in RNA metabolism and viral defense